MKKRSSSKLGDKRLDNVYEDLVQSMGQRLSIVLRQLADDRSQEVAFGRFINNAKLSPDQLLEQFWHTHPPDLKGQHVLIIEDSTKACFGFQANRSGLGYVGPKTSKSGFTLHPAIVMNAEQGTCYGLGGLASYRTANSQTEAEEQAKMDRRRARWKIPFEQKERYKWYRAVEQAIAHCRGADQYTVIGDREADIYDLLGRFTQQGWGFVLRAAKDRTLSDAESSETLFDLIKSWPVQGSYQIDLPATDKRSAHTAELDVKYGPATVKCPKWHPDKDLPDQVSLYVVQVKEAPASVVGKQKPVHWILLSSHPVHTWEEALQIIRWYRWRWVIEQVFRTLKSKGLDLEQSQLTTYEGLLRLATLALLAAVQVLQLVQARDGQNTQSIDSVFFPHEVKVLTGLNKKLEGKTSKQKNPNAPDSLAFASWVIARLGGWSGYQVYKPPGPITMLRGMVRFYDILEGTLLLL